jgi:hypothetical protein
MKRNLFVITAAALLIAIRAACGTLPYPGLPPTAADSAAARSSGPLRIGGEMLDAGKELVVGGMFGAGLGFFGLIAGAAAFHGDEEWSGFGEMVYFGYLGYAIGNSYGVYTAGNDKQHRGPFLPCLAGCLIGAGIGTAMFVHDNQTHTAALCLALGPPIGSLIGFDIFRKDRTETVHRPSACGYFPGSPLQRTACRLWPAPPAASVRLVAIVF